MQAAERTTGTAAGLVADSRTVALWTLASRLTGFVRVAAMAAILGPTFFGNLFQTTALVPGLLFGLLGGSLVGAVLVPRLVHPADAGDGDAVRRLANGFLGAALLVLLAVAGAVLLAGPWLLALATAAVDDPEVRSAQLRLGVLLLAMQLPQLLLSAVVATAIAVQHAHGRFALAAAAPIAENLVVIAVLGLSAARFGAGTEIGAADPAQVALLGLGGTAAVAVHAALQWWGARRAGVTLVPGAGWRIAEVRRALRASAAASRYTGLHTAVGFALVGAAGGVPGAVVALQIGQNFASLPVALGAAPMAAAQLPRLSRSHSAGALAEFHGTFRDSVALTRFVALPAGLLLFALCEPLARAVAFGPMDTANGTAMVAACIGGLGLGVLGEAVLVVATSASYARHDAAAPFHAMALRLAVAVAGIATSLALLDGVPLLWGLAAASSAGSLASAAYLYGRTVRGLPRLPPAGGRLPAEAAVAAGSVLAGGLLAWPLAAAAEGPLERIVIAGTALLVSGALYLALQRLRGSPEARALLPVLFRPGPAQPAGR